MENLDRNQLDKLTQKVMADILDKDLSNINEDDAAFLRARSLYLTAEEVEKYADFLVTPEPKKVAKNKEPKKVADSTVDAVNLNNPHPTA